MYHRSREWGYWDNDTPQRLVVSGTYQLPVGKGHAIASSGALEKVFGDWQLNAIATFASGQPLTIGITQDNSGTQSGNRPNCTTPASGFHRSIADWVSPSGYSAPAQFFFRRLQAHSGAAGSRDLAGGCIAVQEPSPH